MIKTIRPRTTLRATVCGLATGAALSIAPHAFAQTAPERIEAADAPLASDLVAPDLATPVTVTRVTLSTGGLAEVEGRMAEPDDAMRLAIERP